MARPARLVGDAVTRSTPTPGDVWSWPDGKLAILTAADIEAGEVVMKHEGRRLRFPIAKGRRRDEPHIIAIAMDLFGVPDAH